MEEMSNKFETDSEISMSIFEVRSSDEEITSVNDRLNHQNNFVPKAVLTKIGRFPVNAARQNLSSQATTASTARKVNTARPIVNCVNTTKGNAVKSNVKGNWENVVKPSAHCEWRPINVLDNVSKDSASMILKRVDYIDAHGRSKFGDFVPDLWIVVLRIGKLQGLREFSGVGFISTQQMVINSPCLTDTKNWLFQCKRHLLASLKQTTLGKDFSNPLMVDSLPKTIWLSIHLVVYNEELAIPGQTTTGKESSNSFMAGSLPKTMHFCDSLQSDEDSFDHIKLMILCTNFLIMVHDLENLKTSHLLKKEFLQMYPNRGGLN
ncbi:hypothetical protein Tco_0104100 [Tanacetum coccineum]